ncbi:MAG: hypothetical protein JWR38_2691 [Mucilaginibacter sp.]|nr:hypothetical protein [Mucilaginibacter sp.]
MPKEELTDLLKFLSPFPAEVQQKALWLRDLIWGLYPQANELIYDNYNALAFGWSPTEKVGHGFCSIAVFRTNNNVHFGFYWGAELADPEKLLIGNGNQYRYVLVKSTDDFPKAYITQLMQEAWLNSLKKIKDPKQIVESKTISKSVSLVKREKKQVK